MKDEAKILEFTEEVNKLNQQITDKDHQYNLKIKELTEEMKKQTDENEEQLK